MQRTQFGHMACSIARTLDVIGEPWSPLILRDVWVGIRRVDAMAADLGISRKVLAERLAWLVESGVLAREEYSAKPPRYEYVLTEKGAQLCDVLVVMAGWGDRWLAGDAGAPVLHRHHTCGRIARAEVCCSECGEPLGVDNVDVLPGPGAAVAG
jgi:DNA-binding HxlR family transcriptional regulator